ncbi:putative Mitogen-activated protein kinase kinase kinase 2 [Hypsibius exemplaris]|uniref:non-specific serine/threonine protein kinase n=1 Tax=Hypsibius exemplaris TaxID=2072580 RepID=A0A9X6NML0_HYPEX|nr:putative Mitogen-activated protein kinase kinase kinase 2 [Hypsibius exemplaris]
MKFCSGKTLTEFIESNKMYCSTNVLVDYTFQLASGLRYLHENMEFIHGHVVPTSILMKDSMGKKIKIANLDCAFQRKSGRSLEEHVKSLDLFQSPGVLDKSSFMSPEILSWLPYSDERNRRPLSSSTDIWSLGCVVLDMHLVREGQPGLRLDIRSSDYYTILTHECEGFPLIPQIPKDMPDDLKVLACLCLKVNPDDRPTAATLLNYADRGPLILKAFDLREITATASVHDADRSSGTFEYKFDDCFSDLGFEFSRIPAGYVHRFTARRSFGFIYTVDAFYMHDGNPVEKHAGNQACRLLFESETDARLEELKSLLQLRHPNILQYIVIGYASRRSIVRSHYCLLMEWCSGITLRDFIRSNPTLCSTKRIVKYTTQVASGLHYLHEGNDTAKFVHGDITSSNIMIKESTGENLKIIDIEKAFQQPRGLRPSKKEFNVKGSFYFMSPELAVWLFRQPDVTPPTPDSPTDIYSLGCVVMDMYFASQGQALWPDHDEFSVLSAVIISEHPLTLRMPENLPYELKILARQCLQINPSDRPTAATLVNYVARVCGNPYFKCAEDGIQYYLPTSKKQLGKLGEFGVVDRVDAFSVGADLIEQGKQHLALKTFHDPLEKDEIEKIETILLKLNHPNIVKYLATRFFENDRQFMLIMEWCSGGTLTDAAAAETALPVEMQKNYLNQLICGIYYLHMEVNPSIVHKDLKGMNLVFSDENKTTLKICDLDSCSVGRRVKQQSVISRVRLTPGFVSPELLKWENSAPTEGDYPVGRATDIWSLGAVVLEMYCRGNLPDIRSFQRGDILTTTIGADAILKIPPIGEELLAFAAKCLVNEPGDRPSIELLRDDFSKGFSSPPLSAPRTRSLDAD